MNPFWSAFSYAFGTVIVVGAIVAYLSNVAWLVKRFGWPIHVTTVLLVATAFGVYVGVIWSAGP